MIEQAYATILYNWRLRYDVLIGVKRADIIAKMMQRDAFGAWLRTQP